MCNPLVRILTAALCGSAALHAAAYPTRQSPGTIVVDASQFFSQIPRGDTIDLRTFGRQLLAEEPWLFNNTTINLGSAEEAVAK